MATSEVCALALSKKFLMRRIFPKYPAIYRDIKADSHYRYHSWMREGIMKHKYAHIEMVNKKSTYNSINLKNKYIANVASNQLLLNNSSSGSKSRSMRQHFSERIISMDEEVGKIDNTLSDFLNIVSTDFNGFVAKIDKMKDGMVQIKQEARSAEQEYIDTMDNIKKGFPTDNK
jgi:hypothetical protein